MTDKIINFLIEYLTQKFENSEDFGDLSFHIGYGYEYSQELDCPQIAIQCINDTENSGYTTFEDENVTSIGLQFNVYANTMSINNEIYKARGAVSKISNALKSYMNELKFGGINMNFLTLIRVGKDFSMPLDNTGAVYVSVVRFDCNIANPYNEDLENI